MIASILWLQSAFNFFLNRILICYSNIWTLPPFQRIYFLVHWNKYFFHPVTLKMVTANSSWNVRNKIPNDKASYPGKFCMHLWFFVKIWEKYLAANNAELLKENHEKSKSSKLITILWLCFGISNKKSGNLPQNSTHCCRKLGIMYLTNKTWYNIFDE